MQSICLCHDDLATTIMWAVRNATGFYFNHSSIGYWRTLQFKDKCMSSRPQLLGEEHWQWLIILLHCFFTTLTTLDKDLSMTKLPYSLALKAWSKGWFSGATLETYQCKLGHGGKTNSWVLLGALPSTKDVAVKTTASRQLRDSSTPHRLNPPEDASLSN